MELKTNELDLCQVGEKGVWFDLLGMLGENSWKIVRVREAGQGHRKKTVTDGVDSAEWDFWFGHDKRVFDSLRECMARERADL